MSVKKELFKRLCYAICLVLDRASMRLAYQDMSIERKKQEEKLKMSDPKKAEQLERLGMGFSSAK